jgi:hypothetical protein
MPRRFAVVVTKRRKHVPDDVLWGSILIFGLMLICFALACALTSLDNEESADKLLVELEI